MSQPKTRGIVRMVLTNFFNSFRPRQITGNLIGTDTSGTKYYEIPANPSIGKRKPARWFEPIEKEKFDQEIPSEWESWLRGRRVDPPTVQELATNVQIMQSKKEKAIHIDEQYAPNQQNPVAPQDESGMRSFPQYREYEVMPGKQRDKE